MRPGPIAQAHCNFRWAVKNRVHVAMKNDHGANDRVFALDPSIPNRGETRASDPWRGTFFYSKQKFTVTLGNRIGPGPILETNGKFVNDFAFSQIRVFPAVETNLCADGRLVTFNVSVPDGGRQYAVHFYITKTVHVP